MMIHRQSSILLAAAAAFILYLYSLVYSGGVGL